jgi:phytoene synthase
MQDDATAVLKKHGKTFNFARFFLGQKTGLAAARLYRFCRIVDDIADDSEDKVQAKIDLDSLKNVILQNQLDHPEVGDFLRLCQTFNIDRTNGIILIEGVSQDLDFKAISNVKELIQYAYKVAGVVGLMMAPILEAKKNGSQFAIDLGIGMQLTNIARDVMEDAQMGRRYIPGNWVNELSAEQIAKGASSEHEAIQSAIASLLKLAEDYYNSGMAGLYYLPNRNKQAIAVAAYVYREIGRKLRRHHYNYWQGRTYVSTPQKIKLAGQAMWSLNTYQLANKAVEHKAQLHQHLDDVQTHNHSMQNIKEQKSKSDKTASA